MSDLDDVVLPTDGDEEEVSKDLKRGLDLEGEGIEDEEEVDEFFDDETTDEE
ncbi:hypothetical protein IPJ70_03310 [Candidatus Campbellbacteria bacterium]|nr:MAG: hypothetical protein IPJ70_03310 [Candidatus Campbellbacteria bacterium]